MFLFPGMAYLVALKRFGGNGHWSDKVLACVMLFFYCLTTLLYAFKLTL